MNTDQADELIRACLHQVAPDVPLEFVSIDDDLRDALHLDSLDFLQVVELLSKRSGIRIDEEDYPNLATLSSAIKFLTATESRPS